MENLSRRNSTRLTREIDRGRMRAACRIRALHGCPSRPANRPLQSVTTLLVAWTGGESSALEQLTPLVHRELRRLARSYLRRERAEHTLQTDALVNEAYVRLVDSVECSGAPGPLLRAGCQADAADPGRLRTVSAVPEARRGCVARSLDDAHAVSRSRDATLVDLDNALAALAVVDARKAQVVEMRFFAGLQVSEIAGTLHVSPETVMRDWRMAKMWLLRELSETARAYDAQSLGAGRIDRQRGARAGG